MVRHQIHFRKDDFPGQFGQDRRDNARVNVIFASERNDCIVANKTKHGSKWYNKIGRV